MLYKIITIHGDLNLRTIQISYTHIEETGGNWNSETLHVKTNPFVFSATIPQLLQMNVVDFKKMEQEVSVRLSAEVLSFINAFQLEHKIDFIANLGIVVDSTLSIENNAALAAKLQLPVIGQFNEMNQVLGGDHNFLQIGNDILDMNDLDVSQRKIHSIALMGVLRWREAYNVKAAYSGAVRDHIGGCIWLGVEA